MHRRDWIVALLLAAATAPATAAESGCPYTLRDLPDLEIEELADRVFDVACPELREPLAQRIDDLIAAGQTPEEVDDDELMFLSLTTTGIRLNAALWRGDLNTSNELFAKLQQQVDAMELAALAEDAKAGQFDLDEEEPPSAFLSEIAAVLAGVASRNVPQTVPSPEPDWILRTTKCGFSVSMFNLDGVAMPSRADAWVAIGAPEVGLQWLLADHWVEAMSYGRAPPRLREFAQRAFGAGAYETEIKNALASIRIEDMPTGRHAGMRLFGMWVPLPIGREFWRDEVIAPFEDEAEIAEFLRRMLLPEPEATARDPSDQR